MLDSLIFDLDGTLWNTVDACVLAWNDAVNVSRLDTRPFTRADLASIMGFSHDECFRKMFPELNSAEREQIAQSCYDQELIKILESPSLLYDGVADGIIFLSRKLRLFLVSNCQRPYLDLFFFKHWELKSAFCGSECHGNNTRSKSENISLLIKRFNLRFPVYIGDTEKDQLSSEAAGIPFWHMSYGFGVPLRPCPQFKSFSELVSHVERELSTQTEQFS